MLKAKIKISQLSNLTDARYFAAWGVDYVGFDIDPVSDSFCPPHIVKEIADWIEGPRVVLECPENVEKVWLDNYTDVLGDIIMEKVVQRREELSRFIFGNGKNDEIIILRSELPFKEIDPTKILSLCKSYDDVFLDAPFRPSEITEILSSGITGIVLRGGDEEKVGVKSFEELDELFELILEE